VTAAEQLKIRCKRLTFGPPVKHVYNPLDYAWPVARAYYEMYGHGPKEVLFVGMNPGPFGMGQTGVPFGEVAAVRDYLQLSGPVSQPKRTHKKRPIEGFDCPRSEISGNRLWNAIAEVNPNPETFFDRAFVINYCPLLFLNERAANVTPDQIKVEYRRKMEKVCDKSLEDTIRILKPKHVVGIGQYAAKCITRVTGTEAILMPHPSPANPKTNLNWLESAQKSLTDAGLIGFL